MKPAADGLDHAGVGEDDSLLALSVFAIASNKIPFHFHQAFPHSSPGVGLWPIPTPKRVFLLVALKPWNSGRFIYLLYLSLPPGVFLFYLASPSLVLACSSVYVLCFI